MNTRRPLGIMFISYFQFFGALLLLFTFNIEQTPTFNQRFGILFLPESLLKHLIIGFGFFIAFGYLKQTKWGFFTMLIYSFIFCIISFLSDSAQSFIGNGIYALFVTLYTLTHAKFFHISLKPFNMFPLVKH